ncbi:RGS domain-containing protein [Lipomyces oligophaga]|uniref:RGS domain-containing protein n=1 Tax=Lipomyces oligophaga TaxID=45792 RepID=UPI0034CD07EE
MPHRPRGLGTGYNSSMMFMGLVGRDHRHSKAARSGQLPESDSQNDHSTTSVAPRTVNPSPVPTSDQAPHHLLQQLPDLTSASTSAASSPTNSAPNSPAYISSSLPSIKSSSYLPAQSIDNNTDNSNLAPTSVPQSSAWFLPPSSSTNVCVCGRSTSPRCISIRSLPSLDEVLANDAPSPYSLAEFMAYLAQNHCLETLEFTTDVHRYTEVYEAAVEVQCGFSESELATDHKEFDHIMLLWRRLIDSYVRPDSARELNLPSTVRDELLLLSHDRLPPSPDKLATAMTAVKDLMKESVFMRFLQDTYVSSPSGTSASDELDFNMMTTSTSNISNSSLSSSISSISHTHHSYGWRLPLHRSFSNTQHSSNMSSTTSSSRQSKSSRRNQSTSSSYSDHDATMMTAEDQHCGNTSFPESDEHNISDDSCGPESDSDAMMLDDDLADHPDKHNMSRGKSWRRMGKKLWHHY